MVGWFLSRCAILEIFDPLEQSIYSILTDRGWSILGLALCFQKTSYLFRTYFTTWFISSHWLMTLKSNVLFVLSMFNNVTYIVIIKNLWLPQSS